MPIKRVNNDNQRGLERVTITKCVTCALSLIFPRFTCVLIIIIDNAERLLPVHVWGYITIGAIILSDVFLWRVKYAFTSDTMKHTLVLPTTRYERDSSVHSRVNRCELRAVGKGAEWKPRVRKLFCTQIAWWEFISTLLKTMHAKNASFSVDNVIFALHFFIFF